MASLHPRRLFAELFVHNLRIRAWRAGWWWVTKSSSGFRRGPERHRGQWVVSGELTRFSQAPQYRPASPTDRLLKRMETGRGGCCNPSPASVSDQVHQTSYPYEEAFIQDTGAIHKRPFGNSQCRFHLSSVISSVGASLGRSRRRSTPREVIEVAMAHVVQNRVEAIYARSDLCERLP